MMPSSTSGSTGSGLKWRTMRRLRMMSVNSISGWALACLDCVRHHITRLLVQKHISRQSEVPAQLSDMIESEAPLTAQHLRHDGLGTKERHEIFLLQAVLFNEV